MFVIIKTGSTLPNLISERGDFEAWFAAGLGLPRTAIETVAVHLGAPLPRVQDCSAVVVTGSAAMVTDRSPWSVETGRWLVEVVAAAKPLLAVCYGHQLLADALGGTVTRNPRGREIGTISVDLTSEGLADPLFEAMPSRLQVQATHVESVVELPSKAVRLGSSPLDPNQAFRVGRRAWAVQFHPEFTGDVARAYIEGRRDPIEREGLDPDALIAGVQESDHGGRILRRFARLATER